MAFTGYKVVRADDLSGLERAVLALAGDGYVPYGPSGQEDDGSFLQTMIQGDVAGGATSLDASAVDVAAGTDGLAAGTAQDTFQDVYTQLAVPTTAADVGVEAGTDGLAAGTAQATFQDVYTQLAVPTTAADVSIEASTDGLNASTAQEVLQALATRIAALETP